VKRFEDVPVFVALVDCFGNPPSATPPSTGEKHGFAVVRVAVDQESDAQASADWLQV
jgi:hypothetical protein